MNGFIDDYQGHGIIPLPEDDFGLPFGFLSQPVISESRITDYIPGLNPTFPGDPVGDPIGVDEALRQKLVYIDDHSRMPDLILEFDNVKYLCWVNVRAKDMPDCWRICCVKTDALVDNGVIYRYEEYPVYDPVEGDNVPYTQTLVLWPYGLDSYNFDINKIKEYPFRIKGIRY